MSQQQEAIRILRRAGEQGDDSLDLAETALALAAIDQPQSPIDPYRAHLASLAEQVRALGPARQLDEQLRILRRVLVVQNKYSGEEEHFDDIRNANLMHVIDRRRGLPVALGILYLHVAEAVGWPMVGLNFPGHFFVRLAAADGRAIIDPFRAGQTCHPDDLHEFLPYGEEDEETERELAPDCCDPVSKRDVLLRLQNNVKRRLLDQDRLDPAIATLQGMILFAPRRHELWRELGYLQAERGNLRSAITALEVVRDLTGEVVPIRQADDMLRQLRRQLN